MRKLHEIAGDLRAELAAHFRTVRLSTVQNTDQMLAELKAINPEKLPGVLIVFDGYSLVNENTLREIQLTLVVIDRFRADSDERALSAWHAAELLLELFPPTGRKFKEEFYLPVDCSSSGPSGNFCCLAFGLTIKQ